MASVSIHLRNDKSETKVNAVIRDWPALPQSGIDTPYVSMGMRLGTDWIDVYVNKAEELMPIAIAIAKANGLALEPASDSVVQHG